MIRYTTENLLQADVEALVNPVNCVGVMGKGLALQFKKAFPGAYKIYAAACKADKIQVGQVYVVRQPVLCDKPHWIIHFPTKDHWRDPSRLEWIRGGLVDLRHTIIAKGIKSIALPALGCGNGGLMWKDVRLEIETVLGDMETEVLVFEPLDKET